MGLGLGLALALTLTLALRRERLVDVGVRLDVLPLVPPPVLYLVRVRVGVRVS